MGSPPAETRSFRSDGSPGSSDDAATHAEREGGLLLVAGDGVLTTFSIASEEVIIGRAPECNVVLVHSALSRRHVRLRLGPPLMLEDLGSRNGTRLLGQRLEAGLGVPLSIGQSFQVGPLSFVVVRLRRSHAPTMTGSREGGEGGPLRVTDPTLDGATGLLRDLAVSPLSVLIIGETGVGKEVLAQTIHRLSGRSGALVAINCAAIAPSLIESELFGHEKAAFTGATQQKTGLLEAAGGGTVFLDEVGELPEEMQAKLLRAIEAREITRVGAVKPVALDVRFVAATNRDLATEVAVGRFRSDLYYRLDGVTLRIPPLRECRERLGPLAVQFLRTATGPTAPRLDADLLARLEAHDWPGNVRELKAVLERAVILARGGEIRPHHLTLTPAARTPAPEPTPEREAQALTELAPHEAEERQRIVSALEACAGNQTRAAKQLGISRATLVTKLSIHRIPRPRK